MNFTPRARLVNPRLGTYFGIFASAFTALVLLLLIFEQLGTSTPVLRAAMLLGPLGFYAAIGVASLTHEPFEFFASGRRVPAVYSGLALAMTAMGGTGLVALTGVFFLAGFDALCLVTGGLSGFVVMAILLAPFLRKCGAFTTPSYLGRRFGSFVLRTSSAALLAVPILFLLAAELRTGTLLATELLRAPSAVVTVFLGVALAVTVAPGGLRSLTWSGTAKLIAGLLALMAPVAIVAVLYTSLPLPQLTTGPLLRSLVRREAVEGLRADDPPLFLFNLPGDGFSTLMKPFATAFGAVGAGAFLIAAFTVMAGVAAAPWLLQRPATAPSVTMARKSLGWAAFAFGVVMLTLAAIGIFMRDFVMDFVSARVPPPGWFGELQAMGFASVEGNASLPVLRDLAFRRDAVLFSLPVAAGMPEVMLALAIAGALAVTMAGAASAALTLGNIVAEDIVNGFTWDPPPARLWLGRAVFVLVLGFGAFMAWAFPADPFRLLLWALTLTGATAFPVLVLSVWWKRINAFGALAGMASGFAVTLFAILADAAGMMPFDSVLAGAFGLPAAVLGTILASLFTPPPPPQVVEFLYEIRSPGGEILYDRELRRARMKQNAHE